MNIGYPTNRQPLTPTSRNFPRTAVISIDPSLLLRSGMDAIQAEANTIFRMLEETERVLVLFDEFDELVRDRVTSTAEPFSRLLTTAMLPKLASIHKRAMLVFIIATNNIGEFDLAIRRQGRFDHVVQIMPPTYEAKLAKQDWGQKKVALAGKFEELNFQATLDDKRRISDLTFNECESFVNELANVTSAQEALSLLNKHWNDCTLQTPVTKGDAENWADRCKDEAKLTH